MILLLGPIALTGHDDFEQDHAILLLNGFTDILFTDLDILLLDRKTGALQKLVLVTIPILRY